MAECRYLGAPHQRNVSAKGTLAGLIDVDSLLISLHYTLRILQVLPSRSPACATPDIARGSLMSSFVTLRLQAIGVSAFTRAFVLQRCEYVMFATHIRTLTHFARRSFLCSMMELIRLVA